MKGRSSGVTKSLLEKLLSAQEKRAKRGREISFSQKLRVLDRLMAEGPPKIEDVEG